MIVDQIVKMLLWGLSNPAACPERSAKILLFLTPNPPAYLLLGCETLKPEEATRSLPSSLLMGSRSNT